MDTGPSLLRPCPEAGALRVPGEGPLWGGQASDMSGCPPHATARMDTHKNEKLSAWGGRGGPGWTMASGGSLLLSSFCSLPSTPLLLGPRSHLPGEGGGVARAEDDSGPSCH